jgi:hypothetical protein
MQAKTLVPALMEAKKKAIEISWDFTDIKKIESENPLLNAGNTS